MLQQIEFSLSPKDRGCHLITTEILSHLPQLPSEGLLNLFVKHTSCALTINENFDPDVRRDMTMLFNMLAPDGDAQYAHIDEGADDMPSHFKSTLAGVSISIPISRGKLNMGTWQGIYLCEFRNFGGARNIVATIIG